MEKIQEITKELDKHNIGWDYKGEDILLKDSTLYYKDNTYYLNTFFDNKAIRSEFTSMDSLLEKLLFNKKLSEFYIKQGTSSINEAKQETKIKVSRRKLAMRNGKVDRGINIKKLIERDGNVCYLCKEPTDECGGVYDNKYPNIEHVVPISKGGTHTWDNVKVACRHCNVKKHNMSLEEYRKRNGLKEPLLTTATAENQKDRLIAILKEQLEQKDEQIKQQNKQLENYLDLLTRSQEIQKQMMRKG